MAEAVGKMDAQVDKFTLLISDLLNVSRIQHGKLEYHDEVFDLTEAVSEVVDQVQTTTKEHKLTVSGTVKKKIFGDRDRIGQVLTNLLTNAIKYSPDSETVEVLLSEDKEKATVSVQDHGIGIDERHREKIFTRFYRVQGPNEKTFPGLGIGLFISQGIVIRHGGSIQVESKKGEGSRFTFTIPFRRK
jgi:signal transduction histidine kinase